ncbi:MAG: metallophosphoesterase, partial [Lachnospiraceae bacterium]|nr:metallophosphoesterase [Lachnospiraceae bacterium]
TGNHEYWISKAELEEMVLSLEEMGIICLEDECVSLKQRDANINLIGLDDKSLADETLKNMMLDIGTEDFNILLAHEPQYIDDYARNGVDLVLSGHAHGGQVRLPFVGGMYAPDQGFMPSYTEGEYTVGNTTMIVSRGIGNSVIPLRVFNLPEIVVIKLKSN